jgi:alcohol dehydrogenase, propanol-preferring
MQAMILEKNGPIESSPLHLRDVPDPVPGPAEVRVKVRCCAICRTDLHVIEGDIPIQKMPVIPGHQVVGIVDRLGPGCRELHEGDRVGIAWLRHTDGACRFCAAGRENLCPSSRYTGYHADGGYAQYALVPEAFAYRIPHPFDDLAAAPLLCAGIIGYRSLQRTGVRPGQRLALFGFGSSAHVVLQIALARGCELYVVSRGANHQQLARDLGATWAGPDAGGIPVKVDAAILFAPVGALVPPALNCLDRGGTLALAGIHMSPIPPIDYDASLFQERDIHPVTANTRQDGRELLAEAAGAGVKPHVAQYNLPDANRALQDMKAGRIDGTGVLIVA